MNSLEPGLGLVARQETTDVGRIDILARARDGQTVIVELKVGEGRDAAIGQVARYVGWYTRKEGRPPRAIPAIPVGPAYDVDLSEQGRNIRGVNALRGRFLRPKCML